MGTLLGLPGRRFLGSPKMSFKAIWITLLILLVFFMLLPGLYLFGVFGLCALFYPSGQCI
jgi:hypothetical protein